MTEVKTNTELSYDPMDLKRAIGEYNVKQAQLENKRTDILISLKSVNKEIKTMIGEIEKLVELKQEAEAKGERVN